MAVLGVMAPILGLLGLAIGSFLNVVAYRVPLGLSVVSPASACPGCDTEIRGRDNIPVVSWLLLRGRCRSCRMRISARYPAIEAVTGLAFVGIALWLAPSLVAAETAREVASSLLVLGAFLWLGGASVVLAIIDLDVKRLPDAIVGPTFAVGAVLLTAAALVAGEPDRLLVAAIGAGGGFAFYFLLAFIYPGGMGFGDVKLAGALGVYLGYLGPAQLVVGTAAAFVLGGVIGIVLLVARRASRTQGIPFGPWMLLGAWIGAVAGAPIASAYLSLVGII